MNDKPESDNPPTGEDLESLLGGLDLTPNWAKGTPGVKEPDRRDRSGGGRGGRSGGPRPPRETSRRNLQGVRVKPRRDQPSQNRDAGGGGGRPSYGGGFSDRRDRSSGPRDSRPPRAPRVPVHVDFIPEKKRLSLVVRVIRQSHKVFPLRVVAEKFMENPAFISMKYTVKDNGSEGEAFQLHVCRANGMVFTDEETCTRYVIDHGIEANYESSSKEVDPPAGNFICIGRHRPSGRLIGPPNWHGYQARMAEVRGEIAESLPPEHFAADVEMVHDEEVIEAWKKEVSTRTFYREKLEAPKKEEPVEEAKAETPETSETPAADAADPQPTPETSEASGESDSETETAAAEPESDETPETAEEPEAAADPETPAEPETPTEPEPVVDDRPYEMTREQAEADFSEKYLKKLMVRTKRTILPGYLYKHLTDPGLKSLTDYHLRREHDRPNSIIFALRPAFKHMRLQVFRFEGELVVSGISQHPLPEDLKIAPEIRSILDHVANNPGCNTQEALKAVSNSVDEVPAETVSHFRWLIEKGHLLEFHDDTLYLPHAQAKKSPAAKKKRPPEPAPEPETSPAAAAPEAPAPTEEPAAAPSPAEPEAASSSPEPEDPPPAAPETPTS